MMCGRCMILCLSLVSAITAEARSLGRVAPEDRDRSLGAIQANQAIARQHISPSLDPESSKKFFNKDYPADKRPGVDVLHFKHPYPVVQDSGEFDSDYVKDENSDNGHWKAQQEYDRLRHKLKQEKKEAAKALEKKKEEEQELKKALEKYSKEQDKQKANDAAKKKKEDEHKKKKVEEEKEKKKKNEKPAETEKAGGWSWSWPKWPFSWPKWGESEPPAPKPVAKKGTGVRSATEDTEKAMDNLKDCQEELAKARDELKKLMDELDKAKGKQSDADAALDTATKKHLEAKKIAEGYHDKTSKEEAEHAAAEAAYLKQKARVDKLKAELDAAAAKVKAQRDAADPGGGVYNTHPARSLTISASSPWGVVLMLGALVRM